MRRDWNYTNRVKSALTAIVFLRFAGTIKWI
jgi:hypothetical protein